MAQGGAEPGPLGMGKPRQAWGRRGKGRGRGKRKEAEGKKTLVLFSAKVVQFPPGGTEVAQLQQQQQMNRVQCATNVTVVNPWGRW